MVGTRGQGSQGRPEGAGPRPAARQAPQNTAYSQAAPPEEIDDAPPAENSGGDDIPF